MFSPSPYQAAVIAVAANAQGGSVVVKAGAGSGKTTLITQLVKVLTGSYIALSFNKPIQVEMERRGVNARTFHSLTMSVVGRTRKFDKDKLDNYLRDALTGTDANMYRAFVRKLVSLAKEEGIGALSEDTEQAWSDLADHHDLQLEHDHADWSYAIQLARDTLKWSNSARTYDFADALYFSVKDGLRLPKFDNVVIDEAQDTNKIQLAIVRKLLNEGGRVFAVGDDAQAIYGFRGADSEAINNIVKAFNAQVLPLTVSYRCATSIVKHAVQFGAIEAAPGAVEGKVSSATTADAVAQAQAGDLFVSRLTKPVVTVAYQLLRARKPAFVMGREIGTGLTSLIKKLNAKGVDALITKVQDWAARESEKALAKNQESKVEAIQDKADTILFLIDNLPETDRTVPALVREIENLFKDRDSSNTITLATIHRTKGLEANRVFWLNHNYKSKWARQAWQQQQEQNLCYVAATRAKTTLVLIPKEGK